MRNHLSHTESPADSSFSHTRSIFSSASNALASCFDTYPRTPKKGKFGDTPVELELGLGGLDGAKERDDEGGGGGGMWKNYLATPPQLLSRRRRHVRGQYLHSNKNEWRRRNVRHFEICTNNHRQANAWYFFFRGKKVPGAPGARRREETRSIFFE